jgi:hypothetical protein
VWEECCRLFRRLEVLQAVLEQEITKATTSLLEDTKGLEQILALKTEIAFAKQEQSRYEAESYYYGLISRDIQAKEAHLQKFEEEQALSTGIAQATEVYKARTLDFLKFLNTMRGSYAEADFKEKRNAIDVLGVRVEIHPQEDGEKEIQVNYTPRFLGSIDPQVFTPRTRYSRCPCG